MFDFRTKIFAKIAFYCFPKNRLLIGCSQKIRKKNDSGNENENENSAPFYGHQIEFELVCEKKPLFQPIDVEVLSVDGSIECELSLLHACMNVRQKKSRKKVRLLVTHTGCPTRLTNKTVSCNWKTVLGWRSWTPDLVEQNVHWNFMWHT